MISINRRGFWGLVAVTVGSLIAVRSLVGCSTSSSPSLAIESTIEPPRQITSTQVDSTSFFSTRGEYTGSNLSGWEVVLGDAIHAAPGELPVTLSDIETIHYSDYSELRANIQKRRIMAHNITFKRIYDNEALKYIHTAKYEFQLPYQPSTSNPGLNGETIEGHLSVWDGSQTNLEYLVAFQWVINPWASNYGVIQAWNNPGVWAPVGHLTPDTSWHEVQMALDPGSASTSLMIDGIPHPSYFVTMTHPDWGDEVAARFAAEIVSLYPGEGNGALHKAYFKDWSWIWESHNAYLPLVVRDS